MTKEKVSKKTQEEHYSLVVCNLRRCRGWHNPTDHRTHPLNMEHFHIVPPLHLQKNFGGKSELGMTNPGNSDQVGQVLTRMNIVILKDRDLAQVQIAQAWEKLKKTSGHHVAP